MTDGDADPLTLYDAGIGTERVLAAIAALHAEVGEIRAMLGERDRVRTSRLDLTRGSQLAAEIAAAVGDLEFDAREVIEHTFRDSQLKAALPAIVGSLDAGVTRRIGRLLSRVEGTNLPSGYRVERVELDRPADCATWRVLRI
jgi:hypothetical protein